MATGEHRGTLVSRERAAPAHPRHLCRVVLRPGFRFRDHADFAHAAGALHAARRVADRPCCSWRCGGYGSTPPGSPTGSIPRPTPVRVLLFALMLGGLVLSTSIPKAFESRGLGSPSPLRRCRSAAPLHVVSTPPARTGGAHECHAHYGWLSLSAAVLDRRRIRGRTVAAAALGRGAWYRICSAGGAVLDPGIRRVRRSPTGRSRAATWRSAARCSSSSRSANPFS